MADIFDWSPTAGSNVTVDGVNIASGMPVGNTDNALRTIMAVVRQSFSSTLRTFLSGSAPLPVASGGTGSTTTANARTALELGTMAIYNKDAVDITGGTIVATAMATRTSMGFTTGAGGTVTQATNKSTAVAINKNCGQITTSSAALAGTSTVAFTVNNSQVQANDTVNVSLKSGSSLPGAHHVYVSAVANGSFDIAIHNYSGSTLSDALVINFGVTKGVTA